MNILKKWITLLLVLSCFGQVHAEEIRLASMNYPPFYGKNLKEQGPLIELIVKAFEGAGHTVQVEFHPWIRAMENSKAGKVDGMVGVWHSPKRTEHFFYSDPIFPNKMGFYKRKGEEIRYKDYIDLKLQGYTLGSVRGYIQPRGLAESGISTFLVNENLQTFKILSRKRVDLIVVDKDYARYMLNQADLKQYSENIEWMEPVLEERQQYLIISKKTENPHKKLSDFNKGLKMLRQSGEFKKIMQKHGFDG